MLFDEPNCRILTLLYLPAFNMGLLLAPVLLSYDWQNGSIPLVEDFSDVRNAASFFFYALMAASWLYAWTTRKVSSHLLPPSAPSLPTPFPIQPALLVYLLPWKSIERSRLKLQVFSLSLSLSHTHTYTHTQTHIHIFTHLLISGLENL